mgnify:CR=1 FL=1|jgi:hypothetical protein
MDFIITVGLSFALILVALLVFRYVGLPVYRIEAINIKRLLESVLNETATEDDWNVFVGMPIHHNPQLDDIRVQCAMLAPEMSLRRGLVIFSDHGRAQIEEQLQIINRQHLPQTEHHHD